jgi:hypothetical protein
MNNLPRNGYIYALFGKRDRERGERGEGGGRWGEITPNS